MDVKDMDVSLNDVIVSLKEDYRVEDSLYAEDLGSYKKGLTGKVVSFCELKKVPPELAHGPVLTRARHEELMRREMEAKERNRLLVDFESKIVALPVSVLKFENEEEE